MSSPSTSTKLLIAALTLLVAALALAVDRVHNGDLYLNLLSGRFIVHHGLVSHDPFPTVAQGQPWLNQQWLSEVAFFRVGSALGLTALTVLYAGLVAMPLAVLLWLCRRKGPLVLIGITAIYFPGLLAVIHPRAAGFTVLAFSVLVALIVSAWRARPDSVVRRRRLWGAAVEILALFAIWANLHAGFVAGLLLIGLATAGLAVDRWRGLAGSVSAHRVAALGSVGVLAAAIITLGTPLGDQIWSYLLSFRNPAISLGTQEWRSAAQSPWAVVYLLVAAGFGAWLWLRSPAPRRITALVVTLGFLAFALISIRNIIFVAPALAFCAAWSAPDRTAGGRLGVPIAVVGSGAVGAALLWAAVLGPPGDDPPLGSPLVDYALAHPPAHGRIATYAGTGSYILWRSPHTAVVINGWLEHFSAQELRDNYRILRARANPTAAVERLNVGAVIAHVPWAIRALERHGFQARFATPEGTYLVRRGRG
jgi:hypothetical protein